jgi:aspartate/methionine/tyrosine aminotransferase
VEAFCHHLAQKYKVLLVPGTCFNRPQHVRLGFGSAKADLQEGLFRFSEALRAYR